MVIPVVHSILKRRATPATAMTKSAAAMRSGVCTSGQAAGAAPPAITVPISGSDNSTPPGSGFATVDGIPCNGQHMGTCMGISQNQH